MKFSNIECDKFIQGTNVKIAPDAMIKGGTIVIGDNTIIKTGANIFVTERLEIGKDSCVGEQVILHGRNIELGRGFYTNHHAEIGGGSCFEDTARLRIGYWFHLGSYSIVNIAMPVTIGNEVGMGRFTSIYTHGAYESILNGYPVSFAAVTIGDRVWIPGATVNPGVTIGNDVVIGVGSLVTNDIPSGSLAVGMPAKVIKEDYYPRKLTADKRDQLLSGIFTQWKIPAVRREPLVYGLDKVVFDFDRMTIEGPITPEAERCRNILRRHGIRFKVDAEREEYEAWT